MISIYCDGSSSGKSNKPGGWGFAIVDSEGNIWKTGSGNDISATNNTMELAAAINGIETYAKLKGLENFKGQPVELVSDSLYVLNMASGDYIPKKNFQLVATLKELYKQHGLVGRWVKGHSGDRFNELCDFLAKKAKEDLK